MIAVLPLEIARCDPSRACPQAIGCLRYLDGSDDPRLQFIDASAARAKSGCSLFLDSRGAMLLHPSGCLANEPGLR